MKRSSFSRLALCVLCGASLYALLPASLSHAQQRWTRTYGGTGTDEGQFVQQTSDGGYIVAGTTWSFGNVCQFYLIKTNASGDTLWTRNYGGANWEEGYTVRQTSDTGYIVAGYTNSFGNGSSVYLVKTNASGATLWTQTYGGAGEDMGMSVQQTSDGGYIVAGGTRSFGNGWQVYLIKTNAQGDTLWTRRFGGTNDDIGMSVQQTSDGGYIVSGFTGSFGDTLGDVYLIKTNASGDTLWTKTYGGTNGEVGMSVQQTTDGGYIITGQTDSYGAGDCDVYLIKTNASGDTLWTRTYGGTGGDNGFYGQQTTDGGYIIAAFTESFGAGGMDVYLIKTNASGAPLWTKTYGGTGNDRGWCVQQTTDGGYVVAGNTSSFGDSVQVYLIKTDPNGNVGVEENRQGDKETRGQGERLRATPNPFTTFATLPGHATERFALYDVSGRRVGVYKGDRIGEGLAPGVYFIRSLDSKDKPLRIVKVR